MPGLEVSAGTPGLYGARPTRPIVQDAEVALTPPGPRLAAWPLLRCLWLYRRTPWGFGLVLGMYAGLGGLLALQQGLLGRAVREVQQGRAVLRTADGGLDMHVALQGLAAVAAVALLRALLQYAAAITGLRIQQRLLSGLREAILHQVQRLHLGYHWLHGAGELVTRTTRDADKLRDALTSFWRQGVDSVFVVAGAMGLLWWYAPSLGAVPTLLAGAALWLLVRQADGLVRLDRAVGEAYDHVNQDLGEGVNGVRVIKAFGLEPERTARFERHVARFVALAEQALAHAAWRVPLPQMLVGFGQVWVLGWGLWLVHADRLDLGALVAALLMVNLLVLRLESIARVIKIYADARASAGRIWALLDAAPEVASGRQPLPAGALTLRLSQLVVHPPGGGHAVLDGLSLTLRPGEIVALVGATGAGKSTVASLLPRLVDPAAGEITLTGNDGRPQALRDLQLPALRRAVHVVAQESFLFADSIADNLRLAAPPADDAALWAALAEAGADDFVRALPQGLATRLGDRGVTLSGGQRQRLCIARALLARPAVLVLDDATSALDALTEAHILHGLRQPRSAGGAAPAVLLIASRRTGLALADRVALLDSGHIVAEGRHADLLARRADYRALLALDSADATRPHPDGH